MATRAALLLVGLAAMALVPGSLAARAPTADENLAANLQAAADASRLAVRGLSRPSAGAARARAQALQAAAALEAGARIAPRAVGALQTPSVCAALQKARALAKLAAADLATQRIAAGRSRLRQALTLTTTALADFGIPLAKEFSAFAVNRDLGDVRGFHEFSGLSAQAGAEINEVIVGAANRATANTGEPGARVAMTAGLPITETSAYVVSDRAGHFWSDSCSIADGVIRCRLTRATMHPDEIFSVAFAPKLDRGTKVLVKLRSPSGQRSYALFSIR